MLLTSCSPILRVTACALAMAISTACGSDGPSGPSAVPPPDVSGTWSGVTEQTQVVGGECVGEMLRTANPRLGRRMTIAQAGTRLTVTLSSRGLAAFDSMWVGTIDGARHIAMSWQSTPSNIPFLEGNVTMYYCPERQVRPGRVISATASLDLSPDGQVIEGVLSTRTEVRDESGRLIDTMTDTTRERLTR